MTTIEPNATTARAVDDFDDVLNRVRRIDPSADAAAVRRYLQEISDAGAVLDTIDLRDSTPAGAFAPWWPDENAK